jgi:hypothetical protein
LQAIWSGRRAPSTLAAGDESPMNSRERRVQRAFQRPTRPGLLRTLPHERISQPHKRTGALATQRQEKERTLLRQSTSRSLGYIGKKRCHNCPAVTDQPLSHTTIYESWQRPGGTTLSPTASPPVSTMCVVQIVLGMPRRTDFSKKWPPGRGLGPPY